MANLYRLGMEYHYRTETFDRSITDNRCGADGGAIPRDGWERGQMTANASSVLSDLCRREGISSKELIPFIQQTAHISYEVLDRIYNTDGILPDLKII